MNISRFKLKGILILIFVMNLCLLGSAYGQQHLDKKVYIGLTLPYSTIKGDFDATKSLQDNATGEIFRIPEADGAMGFGGYIGYGRYPGGKMGYGIEVGYERTSHDVTDGAWTGNAKLNVFSINLRGFYDAMPIEPYLLLGVAVPRLVVNDGAILSGLMDDVTYSGLGANMGFGVNLYVLPVLCITGNFQYRYISYSQVQGIGDKLDISGGLTGSGLNISGSLVYHFSLDRY